jgi:hypothetical protein
VTQAERNEAKRALMARAAVVCNAMNNTAAACQILLEKGRKGHVTEWEMISGIVEEIVSLWPEAGIVEMFYYYTVLALEDKKLAQSK